MSPRSRHAIRMTGVVTLAGITGAVTVLAAAQRLVYTRQEGRQLEQRIDSVEHNYREDVKSVETRLDAILMEIKRR